jgi:predicted TIM-barrel fold metal-dependent hydrolase
LENQGKKLPDNPMRESRIYVAFQSDDDVPYVLKYAGEDNLLLGSDYGHTDQSSELAALQTFRKEAQAPPKVREKVLDQNPRAFYNRWPTGAKGLRRVWFCPVR